MNGLQRVEFEILCEFIKICKRLDLKYYMICGSALGAAKYKGFIPWDDDIDVALLRKDYSVFIEKAPQLLPEYYFLQNYKTDEHCRHFCSKIRDSRTTYIELDQKNLNINHGVFIDVIPLDSLPDDKNFLRKYRRFRICQLMHLKSHEKYKNIIKCILRPMVDIRKVYENFEKYLLKCSYNTKNLYCNFHNSKNNKWSFDKSIYGDGICVEFEGIDVNIPERFDEYLTAYYGNWRADLPDEKRIGHHYYEVLDLEHPYTDCIEKITHSGRRIKLRKTLKSKE